MSSPFGHALVGLGLFNLYCPRWLVSRKKTGLIYGLVILGACSPDLDFIPGLIWGNSGRFHHGPFHSLGMALVLSLTIGILVSIFIKKSSFRKIFSFVFVLVFSHLVLDFFTADLKAPFGFPLYWPLIEAYYISSWSLLPYVERDFANPAIWSQTLRVFIVESLFFLPFLFLSWKVRVCGAEEPPK
jgi:inner membrane protein